ncbi:MAG: alpha-amylase family glycosyl hydrolase [Clostridia bacterium]|nr:alpha-amylase family glycosyl hydrolase [Clostridia bacterium]
MSSTWLKSAIFYEIYPNSFSDTNGDGYGDFAGITEKLDYIKSLGVNALWLNPHYDSPFMDGGYDVRDYFAVSPRFGSEADFDELIAAAHARGIKVILDLVPGHTSEQNADFLKSAEAVRNELSDRFIWTNGEWEFPQGFRAISGRHDRKGNYIVNFFSTQPALNYGFNRIDEPSWQMPYTSDAAMATREWLKSVMRFWLDRGADGFRVDMAGSLVKNDGADNEKPATSEIWRDIRAMLDKEYPDTVLVSEWSDPQAIRAGFDADFMLDHHGNPYNLLVRAEEREGCYSYFDIAGRGDGKAFADGFSAWYGEVKAAGGYIGLLSCNHDTPRLAPQYTAEQLKLVYATLFTLPGVPFLYYGDEIGMRYIKDLPSVECGFARTGSRTPMQWSVERNAGFSAAEQTFLPTFADKQTNVAAQTKDKKSLLNFIRSLFEFRKTRKEFAGGDFEFLYADGSKPLVYRRGELIIVVNPTKSKCTVPVTVPPKFKPIFSAGKEAKAQKTSIAVQPLSFTVFGGK